MRCTWKNPQSLTTSATFPEFAILVYRSNANRVAHLLGRAFRVDGATSRCRGRASKAHARFAGYCDLVGTWLLISFAFGSGCRNCSKRAQWQNNGECKYPRPFMPRLLRFVLSMRYIRRSDQVRPLWTWPSKRGFWKKPTIRPAWISISRQLCKVGNMCGFGSEFQPAPIWNVSRRLTVRSGEALDDRPAVPAVRPCVWFTSFLWQPAPEDSHMFAWLCLVAEDFNELELVGDYRLGKGARSVTTDGIGVRLVVVRRRCEQEEFYRKTQPFAATAVLRTRCTLRSATTVDGTTLAGSALVGPVLAAPLLRTEPQLVLELYNPANCKYLAGENRRWALATDLTAPLALTKATSPNSPLRSFARPDAENAQAQLVMLSLISRAKFRWCSCMAWSPIPPLGSRSATRYVPRPGFANDSRSGHSVIPAACRSW